jgi:glutamate dehydrogenase/leucine dehydrogenase
MTELHRHIGDDIDVPAGDIGVGAREIGYLFGQWKRVTRRHTGVLTGKGLEYGGSLIRSEATGYGAVYFLQNMLDDAGSLIANGCVAVVEGANMPTVIEAIDALVDAGVLFGPGKAANAGGVAVSGLEMSQNSAKISWREQELQKLLRDIIDDIHARRVEYGRSADGRRIDHVRDANVAGFVKVADAMLAYGVV